MMKLNLISHSQKNEIRTKRLYEILFRIYIFFVTIVALVSVISFFANKILLVDYNQTSEDIKLANQDVLNYEKDVKKINLRLQAISDVQDDFIPWTEILKELANVANDGLVFSSISLNGVGREVMIKGRASEGVKLLDFKRKLDKSLILKSVNFPIQNIAVGKDIDFTVNLNF